MRPLITCKKGGSSAFCAVVLVAQSYMTPMGCSPPGSSVHGVLQARILEWVAMHLQGISLTQVSKLGLLHWQADSLPSEPTSKFKY